MNMTKVKRNQREYLLCIRIGASDLTPYYDMIS